MERLPLICKKVEIEYQRLTNQPSTSNNNDLIVFKKSELAKATNNFGPSNRIGEDESGSLYKGVIKSKQHAGHGKMINVAVRKLTATFFRAKHEEWINEINAMGNIKHPNLVKLIGYCAEDGEKGISRFLVHEFLCNGSVYDHLHNPFHQTLPWARRLRIARDVAHGLQYLHEQVEVEIVYRVFKSSIVLLDEEWNAQLSDFVLARLGPFPCSHPVNEAVVDLEHFIGWKPMKFINNGRLTRKDDIWSYGVFILELITGRRTHIKRRPLSEGHIVELVRPHLSDSKNFHYIMDPRLEGQYSFESAWELAALGNLCLAEDSGKRPSMSEVSAIMDKIVEAASDTKKHRLHRERQG
ncbi:hypothetical protein L1049_014154 [Liquidambar formosana]|uniref:Protein kinase domain-containing protein n=1 Tax=Liquidambar formosana TaxID=63359 RepID=A0AAP0WV07_LIQFO